MRISGIWHTCTSISVNCWEISTVLGVCVWEFSCSVRVRAIVKFILDLFDQSKLVHRFANGLLWMLLWLLMTRELRTGFSWIFWEFFHARWKILFHARWHICKVRLIPCEVRMKQTSENLEKDQKNSKFQFDYRWPLAIMDGSHYQFNLIYGWFNQILHKV